jgi:hypothetical protein
MAKTSTAPQTDDKDATRHPKEIAAELATMRAEAASQGLPHDVPAQLAMLAEFAEAVAATYE